MIFLKNIILLVFFTMLSLGFSKFTNIKVFKDSLNVPIKNKFRNDSEQSSYALGASLGNVMKQSLDEQKRLGIVLDKKSIFLGIKDSLMGDSILSKNEVALILKKLDLQLKSAENLIILKEVKENYIKGKEYINQLLVKKNARHTKSGLVFFIKKPGSGNRIKDSDIITVNYKGYLINGNEFDNSYKRGKPLSFPLDSVIEGWKEGLKYIKKGGLIKLVIPPNLAYGESGVSGIPGNSTLVFDIELIDVQSK